MKLTKPKGALVDQIEQAAEYPGLGIILPDRFAVAALKVGETVKITLGPSKERYVGPTESFWVEIAQITEPGVFVGRVDNDLDATDVHGVEYNDFIIFDNRHIQALHA